MFGKYRRLNEGLFWQNYGVYHKPEDPPADPPKDPPADPAKDDKGADDKDPKEGKFEIQWKVDDKNRKFFIGPDGQKFYSGDDLKRVVSDRLNEDRGKQKTEAERIASEKQGEFEKLYKAEQEKVAGLTVKAEKFDRLAEQFHKTIDAQISEWPAELKNAVPGVDTDVEARAAQVTLLTPAVNRVRAGNAINGEHGQGGGKDVKDVVTEYTDRRYTRPSDRAKAKAGAK